MKPKPDREGGLSARELGELKDLRMDLCGVCYDSIGMMLSLAQARRASVPDRLACIIQDCLMPALRDLGSIVAEAREHARPAKQRRPDDHRKPARRTR